MDTMTPTMEELPLGDIVYNWLLLKLNQTALELRDLINEGGFGVLVNAEMFATEITEYLTKGIETDESNGQN